jgi:hypothetical protein
MALKYYYCNLIFQINTKAEISHGIDPRNLKIEVNSKVSLIV